jgi:AraC family transcriptional regulator, regulatory protein of adaptative response / DNA-3-methyladenine glycosylase II
MLHRAFASRDARLDGHYFVGAKTTKVFCRPICRSPVAKVENCDFFLSAAAALEAGYRPCLRCRPEVSRDLPASGGTSTTVVRALRLISTGVLDDSDVDSLAGRLGVGERHLRRLFAFHLGTSPLTVLQAKRVHLVQQMVIETSLPMTEIAYAAGFHSLRRFNDAVRKHFGCTPRDLRRGDSVSEISKVRLKIRYKPPYDWGVVARYLRATCIEGVERIDDGCYRRSAKIAEGNGIVSIEFVPDRNYLVLALPTFDVAGIRTIVERVRSAFDVHAETAVIARYLRQCPELEGPLAAHPGVRVSGGWDRFETIVRTLVECEAPATNQLLLSRLASGFGVRILGEGAACGIDRLFPDPGDLVDAELASLGLEPQLAAGIRAIAAGAASGSLDLDSVACSDTVAARLRAVDGLNPDTADYIGSRLYNEGDAHSARDWRSQLIPGMIDPPLPEDTPTGWASLGPWRGYAAMVLWADRSDPTRTVGRATHSAAAFVALSYAP